MPTQSHAVDATVDNDHHQYTTDGWYSLQFDAVEATGLAIRFARDAADSRDFVQYRVWEMSVHAAPDEPQLPGEETGLLGRLSSDQTHRLNRPTPGALNRPGRSGPPADGQADSVVTFNEIQVTTQGHGWVELYNQYGVSLDLSRMAAGGRCVL